MPNNNNNDNATATISKTPAQADQDFITEIGRCFNEKDEKGLALLIQKMKNDIVLVHCVLERKYRHSEQLSIDYFIEKLVENIYATGDRDMRRQMVDVNNKNLQDTLRSVYAKAGFLNIADEHLRSYRRIKQAEQEMKKNEKADEKKHGKDNLPKCNIM